MMGMLFMLKIIIFFDMIGLKYFLDNNIRGIKRRGVETEGVIISCFYFLCWKFNL